MHYSVVYLISVVHAQCSQLVDWSTTKQPVIHLLLYYVHLFPRVKDLACMLESHCLTDDVKAGNGGMNFSVTTHSYQLFFTSLETDTGLDGVVK
jgi:hypothetical protein